MADVEPRDADVTPINLNELAARAEVSILLYKH